MGIKATFHVRLTRKSGPALVGLLFGALTNVVGASSPVHAEVGATQVDLKRPLSFITSAVWLPGRGVVVTDATPGESVETVVYGESGNFERSLSRDTGRYALIGTKVGNDYVQIFRGAEMHWLDEDFSVREIVNLQAPDDGRDLTAVAGHDAHRIIAFYDWTAVGGDQLVAYGLLSPGDPKLTRVPGFFRMEVRPPGGKGVSVAYPILDFDYDDFYLLGYPFLAAIGADVYFLAMPSGGHPVLYRYDVMTPETKPRPLTDFPDEDKRLPDFVIGNRGRNDESEVFEEVEAFDSPMGLYGKDDGMLYSLHRKPGGSGETIWTLTKMRPNRDNVDVLDTVKLPTSASHVTIVGITEGWFIFEKPSRATRWKRPPKTSSAVVMDDF